MPELAGEVGDVAADLAPAPGMGVVPAVDAVGAGVLADDQELLDAGRDQPLRLAQHRVGRARDQPAAHVGDDAEAALVVTALGDLEVAVVARGEVDGAGRQEVDEGVGLRRHGGVDGVEHRLVLVRAGDGEDVRVRRADVALVGAEAAGDDDPAVLGQRLADRLEALGLGAVEKAAGVDDDRVGAGVVGRDGVALGAQPRQDALAVDQRLGAAEADHADARLAGPAPARASKRGSGGAVGAQVGRVGSHRLRIAARGPPRQAGQGARPALSRRWPRCRR